MSKAKGVQSINPLGECPQEDKTAQASWPLNTPAGRFYAEWDDGAPVSREGQLIFFFQFLEAGARWSEFLKECPLHYTGNRGSGALNVMGTILLSVLCGHWRFAHINAVRGDGVNPPLLGMDKVVSEDTVRMALSRIDENEGLGWLRKQLLETKKIALTLINRRR